MLQGVALYLYTAAMALELECSKNRCKKKKKCGVFLLQRSLVFAADTDNI